jgi:hypothetical protein
MPLKNSRQPGDGLTTAGDVIRRQMILYPDCTVRELMAVVEAAGFTAKQSHVHGMRADIAATIRIARELGRWVEPDQGTWSALAAE